MPDIHEFSRRFHERYCIYRYSAAGPPDREPPGLKGLSWTLLDAAAIRRDYAADPHLMKDFIYFLHQGAIGVSISVAGEWASYLWMSTPGNPRPPHVAANNSQQAYFFFYGATRTTFGGLGLFKFAMRLIINEAFERSTAPEILADPAFDNIASRRAHISTGFVPAGMLDCWYLWLPRVGRWPLRWKWDKTAAHPSLPAS